MLIKTGDGNILGIVETSDKDDVKLQKALRSQSKEEKDLLDGNKTESSISDAETN